MRQFLRTHDTRASLLASPLVIVLVALALYAPASLVASFAGWFIGMVS